jgi:serine/threonine-protein kinase
VLEQPADARAGLLAAVRGDDAALHEEVLWLIEAAENAAADDLPSLPALPASPMPGSMDAPLPRNYRLLSNLGEGGMGVVHLAERIDGELGQRVALKLLHAGSGNDGTIARRFAAERRILVSLNHPNIAHLVDAGVNAEGRPFLAMEYVDGERIDHWCELHAASLKARIELFLKVCAAVEYAHRHLVIHRDIKPANILVTADGEPKLLDFGIARLLDDDGTSLRTETGLRALTLAYASPEQIEGASLSTATDIYSLGVVLYQLVTGARPFDHLESAHLLSNAIVSGEITPPSRQTRQHARNAFPSDATRAEAAAAPARAIDARNHHPQMKWRVPADVDAIILKALRREPGQRYATVGEFADDLRRFLTSRPVRARRGQWHYRASRFAWRWRWALAVAVALLVLSTSFAFYREIQLERVALERDRAQALLAFMNDLFENADSLRSRGNQVTVREMLDRGARELQGRKDLSVTQRSSMLSAMGHAYNALGLGQEALPLLKAAQALQASTVASAEERAAVLSELAAAYSTSRDTVASVAADAEAIALLQDASGDHADEIMRLQIRKLHNHANLLDMPLADIRARLHAILTDLKARARPPDTLLLQAYRALAAAYSDQSDARLAVEMAKNALEIATRLYGPDDPRILPNRHALAMAMRNEDAEQAAALYQSLVTDYERLVGPGLSLASILNNHGILLSQLGRVEQSVAVYRRAAAISLASGGADHRTYLVAISNLATLHARNGNPQLAQSLIEGVLPTFAAQSASGTGMNHVNYAAALETLAASQALQADASAARNTYVRADEALGRADADAYPEIRADVLEGLAASEIKLGRDADARTTLARLDAVNQGLSRDDARLQRAQALRQTMDSRDSTRGDRSLPP